MWGVTESWGVQLLKHRIGVHSVYIVPTCFADFCHFVSNLRHYEKSIYRALRDVVFNPGRPLIQKRPHSKKRFLLFKGPCSFKLFFKIGGNEEYFKAFRLIPLIPAPPLCHHGRGRGGGRRMAGKRGWVTQEKSKYDLL
jgi:hypothetical protein